MAQDVGGHGCGSRDAAEECLKIQAKINNGSISCGCENELALEPIYSVSDYQAYFRLVSCGFACRPEKTTEEG
jgi:hypothetical protein